MLLAALSSSAAAGDPPPKPENCIEVEIERDTGTPPPLLDEATLKKFREWRYKPQKVRRVKIPIMLANEKK